MKTMDMTQGKPLGLLVRFAVPLFFSNICQSLYAVADSARLETLKDGTVLMVMCEGSDGVFDQIRAAIES